MPTTAIDEQQLRAAVADANVPILLMLLVQLTGDLRWLEAPYTPSRTVGMEENDDGGLSPELQEEVRSAAAEALVKWSRDGDIVLKVPDDDLLIHMLSVCMGEPLQGLSARGSPLRSARPSTLRRTRFHGSTCLPASGWPSWARDSRGCAWR